MRPNDTHVLRKSPARKMRTPTNLDDPQVRMCKTEPSNRKCHKSAKNTASLATRPHAWVREDLLRYDVQHPPGRVGLPSPGLPEEHQGGPATLLERTVQQRLRGFLEDPLVIRAFLGGFAQESNV